MNDADDTCRDCRRAVRSVLTALAVGLLAAPGARPAEPDVPRDFTFPVPLFSGPWVEDAGAASVLPASDRQLLVYYRVVCGDASDTVGGTGWRFPYPDVAYDEFTVPIFRAGNGRQDVHICDYDGVEWVPNSKWGVGTAGGPVSVPSCAGTVLPAGPVGFDSDGWLSLFDPASMISYEFWQATTVRDGPCQSHGSGLPGASILEAGYADFFDVRGDGHNPAGESSARATGTPLLAGLILPEDVESGSIDHALALGIIGPRNLSPDPSEPLATDAFYPAATTETDHYNTNPDALAAGQRLRATPTLVDDTGRVIVEEVELAPITRMFFAALRSYGAYVVDNAGSLTFWAEDLHTAKLDLADDEINALIGKPPGTPLAAGKTRWQIVIEAINDDLWNVGIPIAYGQCSGSGSTVTVANFEVVANATPGLVFADGFESGSLSRWSASVP